MIANGRWAAAWYSKSMMPGSMDVAPLPHRKFRIGGIATHMMCMSANSNKKDEAWDFIKFLVSEKAQVMVCDDGNNIPALRRVAESDLFLKNKNTPWLSNRVFLEEIPYSTDWPYPPNPYVTMYAVMTLLGKAERDVTLGQETSFSALRGMKVEIDRIIAAQKKYPEPRRLLGSFVFYLAMVCIAAIVYSRLRKAKFLRNGVDKPR
jgi:ABC-type glycerol-3-phosphate transport system substrate-binding protein